MSVHGIFEDNRNRYINYMEVIYKCLTQVLQHFDNGSIIWLRQAYPDCTMLALNYNAYSIIMVIN